MSYLREFPNGPKTLAIVAHSSQFIWGYVESAADLLIDIIQKQSFLTIRNAKNTISGENQRSSSLGAHPKHMCEPKHSHMTL